MIPNCSYNNGTIADYEPTYDLIENIMSLSVNFFGVLFSFLNVLIYSRSEFQKKAQFDLFKHILAKSFVDFLQLSANLFTYTMFICLKYEPIKPIFQKTHYVFIGLASNMSDLLEILTTLLLLLSITDNQSYSVLRTILSKLRLGFYSLTAVNFAFSTFLTIPRWFQLKYFSICINLMSDLLKIWYYIKLLKFNFKRLLIDPTFNLGIQKRPDTQYSHRV